MTMRKYRISYGFTSSVTLTSKLTTVSKSTIVPISVVLTVVIKQNFLLVLVSRRNVEQKEERSI